ncbi:MAG: Hint domain-containing protein [Pseudomonadota bacterium]
MSFAEAGTQPLFAADWALTEIDGERDACPTALRPGGLWSWRGEMVRLDARPDPSRGPLRLDGAIGRAELRRMAARRAARFGRRPVWQPLWPGGAETDLFDTAPLNGSFFVTDGRRAWAVARAPGRQGGGFGVRQLALFCGAVPPREHPLWIVSVAPFGAREIGDGVPAPAAAREGFAPGTEIETPFGAVPVERLRPGDTVLTDSGAAPLRRVRVRPALRALRVPEGFLGPDGPARPIVVGEGTWLGVEAPALPVLFSEADGTPDSLQEALVRAGDLASLTGVQVIARADLIALDVDDGPHGAAVLMAGGVPCLAGASDRASLRCLTLPETLLTLAHPSARFAQGLAIRGAA